MKTARCLFDREDLNEMTKVESDHTKAKCTENIKHEIEIRRNYNSSSAREIRLHHVLARAWQNVS